MSIPEKELVLVVTHEGAQATLLAAYLADKTGLETLVCSTESMTDIAASHDGNCLVMSDLSVVGVSDLHGWQESLVTRLGKNNPFLMLAVFNVDNDQQANELLSAIYLQGVFFRHDSLEMMANGIKRMFAGELWASRQLTSQVIDNLRRQHISIYRQEGNLTTRERQILGLMGMGASNLEIAERLFLSQHTVKSHIYNIFKKIGVKNRTQAVAWARDQLGMPVTSIYRSTSRF